MFNDYRWHSIWWIDVLDDERYEAGTLVVPTGSERQCAIVETESQDRVLFVGDNVKHIDSGKIGVIQRIFYWYRISKTGKDFSYFQVDYETPDGEYLNDTADKFTIHKANFPHSDMEIPV